jgi:hypothetical protein
MLDWMKPMTDETYGWTIVVVMTCDSNSRDEAAVQASAGSDRFNA